MLVRVPRPLRPGLRGCAWTGSHRFGDITATRSHLQPRRRRGL